MLSRISAHARIVAIAAVMNAMPFVRTTAAQQEPVRGASPGLVEIDRALEKVKADPNLTTERTIKTLKWKDSNARPRSTPAWFDWLVGLFLWLEQSARVLVWCAAVMLAAVLVVYILRLVRTFRVAHREEAFVAPTHVRDLDIRPETLPEDIGAAARELWDAGERRASLALLYRGLLSRLIHVHRIPIRESSTEGDCLALASRHLAPRRCEYTLLLVTVWQRFVYGREDAAAATVYALCNDFASVLDGAPMRSSASGAPS